MSKLWQGMWVKFNKIPSNFVWGIVTDYDSYISTLLHLQNKNGKIVSFTQQFHLFLYITGMKMFIWSANFPF
jgi:hypothetical protein